MIQPLHAIALVDGDSGLSLSHIFAEDHRATWEGEIAALSAKLAQKGATHALRLVPVIIVPAETLDHADDTVDALVQAESFIAGFEGDDPQEGISDLLAGIRGAIVRQQARPDVLAALKWAMDKLPDDGSATYAGALETIWRAEGRGGYRP